MTPEHFVRDGLYRYFNKDIGYDKVRSRRPLSSIGSTSEVFVADGGKYDGRIIKMLKEDSDQGMKAFATHAEAIKRLSVLPILPFPKFIDRGKIARNFAVVETMMPGALGIIGAREIKSSKMPLQERLNFFRSGF